MGHSHDRGATPAPVVDLFGDWHVDRRAYASREEAERKAAELKPPIRRSPKVPPLPSSALTLADRALALRDARGVIVACVIQTETGRFTLWLRRRRIGDFGTAREAADAGRWQVARLDARRTKRS